MNKRTNRIFAAVGLLAALAAFWHQRADILPAGPGPVGTQVTATVPAPLPPEPANVLPAPRARPIAGAAMQAPADPILAQFDAWAQRYLARSASERAALVDEGRALAAARRVVLAQLIRTDPRAALDAAVPMVVRQKLPPEILELLEERVSGRGELALNGVTPQPGQAAREASFRSAIVGDQEYRAHVFGRRELPGTVAKTSMNGIALDGHFAVAESPLRVLEAGEKAAGRPINEICDVSGTATAATADRPLNAGGDATAVEYDGTVHILCGANHLASAENRLLAREQDNMENGAAGGPGSSGVSGRPSVTWAQGTKKLLIIRVDFSDKPGTPVSAYGPEMTEPHVADITRQVQDFYADNSFGKTSLAFGAAVAGDSPDVTPVLRMPQPATYYDARMDGIERSGLLHQDARTAAAAVGFNVTGYDRVGVVFSWLEFFWAGLGNINGPNFWINAYYDLRVVAHEIGHNYGVWHANYWEPPSPFNEPTSPAGRSVEYGDGTDVMGGGAAAHAHFSHWNKSILQWIPDSAVTTVEMSGIHRVHQLDAGGANLALPRALKVRSSDTRDYWIGYRGNAPFGTTPNGAYVLWGYNTNKQGHLLNVSRRSSNWSYDAPLPVGEAFTDPVNGFTMRTLAQGGTGADKWIDVEFTFAPSVRWAQTTEYIAGEQEGAARLRVTRSGDVNVATSVTYTTTDGLATSPADYSGGGGSLSWAPGELADKFITIPVVSDTLWEAGERFTVTLTGTGGAVVSGNPTATVAILDAGIRDFGFMADTPWGRVFSAVVQPDGTMIVGGPFQEVYDHNFQPHIRRGFAKLSPDGRLLPEFADGVSGGDGIVRDLLRQPDGRILVAGSFQFIGSTGRSNLARLNADGTLDTSFTATANGPVWSMLRQPDGRILVAGGFTSCNGVPREYVARLNADGTLDSSFTGPNFDGTGNMVVKSLALQPDGKILAGGLFTLSNGTGLRAGLCRLLANGSLDTSFVVAEGTHQAGSPGNPREVRAIVVQPDGRILIGGDFSAYNNTARGGIARLNANGAVDATFTVTTDGRVNALLLLPDGRLVLGGWFFNVNGTALKGIAIVSASGELDTNTASAGGFDGELYDFQLLANGRIQFTSDMSNFEHSTEAKTIWRMISGLGSQPGSVGFAGTTATGSEGANVTLTVNRSGGSSGAVSVAYSATPGTATAADYGTASGTLTWGDGDAAAKTITIALTNDGVAESAETFTVSLSAPAGGATLGAAAQATITIQAGGGPPPPGGDWQSGDVGVVGAAGSSSASGGVVTLTGSGADIWGTADAFQFRHQQLTGDGAITVRVASMGNTHPWAKVGIMFREALTAGSREVMAFVTPGNNSGLQYRLEPGAQSAMGTNFWSGIPVWLMLVRSGDTFGAYRSYDGNNWTPLGTINCDLPPTAYIGLAVSSHVNGTLLSATFDNIEIDGATPPGGPPAAPSDLWATGATASTVTLNWVDHADNETGFAIERAPGSAVGFVEIGTVAANVTTYLDTGLSPNTAYNYRVRARNAAGDSAYSNASFITTTTQAPWSSLDIGGVGVAGNESISGDNLTVLASGADIWTGSDSFRFVYQAWRGDGEIRARVTRLDNTHPWAKAGVMFRETLAPGASNVTCLITAAAASGLQVRSTGAGPTTLTEGPWLTAPYWVRLVRTGNTFTASMSPDGVAWTVRGTQTVPMATDIYVGVAVSSHNQAARTTAIFEGVQLPSTPPPPPPPPPGAWTQASLAAGSGSFTSPDATSVTVTAAGADIWGQFDDGLFVHRAWSGDGEVVTRVESLTNTHPWAKAGLMFRENLTATARNVFIGLTPGAGATFQVRAAGSGVTSEVQHSWLPGAPSWLRLTRSGDTFTAAFSTNGTTWTSMGSQTLVLPRDIFLGFGVSSHATSTTTAVFKDIQLPSGPPPPPPPPPPPATWTQSALGAGSGSFTNPTTPTMNITATGADLWGQFDDGLFVQRAWNGDGRILVRLDSLTNTHPWAKAGIMFRENLTATAPNVFLGLTPSAGAVFQARGTSGGVTSEPGHSWVPGAPCWLRLTRSGNTFTAAFSTNGTTWTPLGTHTQTMPANVYVGFGVSSHSATATTAAFSGLQLQ